MSNGPDKKGFNYFLVSVNNFFLRKVFESSYIGVEKVFGKLRLVLSSAQLFSQLFLEKN